ncbi:hypothetical protein P7E02_21545 [Enterococcus hulanensis]|uniref:hypothetical protein n=1 Tax=Enterococcus hulanensis TaxID=2559929 RepID=UPI00288DF384|nr:hypothetical protein [Enterococcus hulanensis]MDT2662482.1 hypothetical protein [Enterococcus hulanensis]
MKDTKFFLKFGLLGALLKDLFSVGSAKSQLKMIVSILLFLLLAMGLLFLTTGKLGLVPLFLIVIVSIFYGRLIKKYL